MNNRPGDPSKVSVMRWLGDKSLACSQALPPGRVPQVRTSVPGKKKTGAKPPPKLLYPDQGSVTPAVKAFEKNHFQPRYAGANLGHPSRGQGLAGSRENGGRKDSQPPNRAKVISLFTRHRRVGCAPNEQPAWRPKQGKRRALVGRQISGLLTSLAPWTGGPGSHQRTWEEKDGGEAPHQSFYIRIKVQLPL